MATEDILEEVRQERINQDEVFGMMPRRDTPSGWLAVLAEEFGEYARDVNDKRFENGEYRDNMRNELVQVAAVAVAAIEDLDEQYWEKDNW